MTTAAPNTPAREPAFVVLARCWVCGHDDLARVHQGRFDLSQYREQDPELAAYTGSPLWLRRCRRCGFGQPEALPVLAGYFDRMYDQRWSEEWVAQEFASSIKAHIFRDVLVFLNARVPAGDRTLLDIGAHVGRFIHDAQHDGWRAEGVELNPRTAAFAARRTQAVVHRVNADALALGTTRFAAITLIDVLEHIPDPLKMLQTAARLLRPGGWLAVKVPSGPSQLLKERLRAAIFRGYRATVADNLVHVNHFSPRALRLALVRAGFTEVVLRPAAPELPPSTSGAAWRGQLARLTLFRLARAIPFGARLPITFNLQAYARKAD